VHKKLTKVTLFDDEEEEWSRLGLVKQTIAKESTKEQSEQLIGSVDSTNESVRLFLFQCFGFAQK
jgi:hypothetical protein